MTQKTHDILVGFKGAFLLNDRTLQEFEKFEQPSPMFAADVPGKDLESITGLKGTFAPLSSIEEDVIDGKKN